MPKKGFDVRNPDTTKCMVVGCDRKALYRCRHQNRRGYCKRHKPVAQTFMQRRMENDLDGYLTSLENTQVWLKSL